LSKKWQQLLEIREKTSICLETERTNSVIGHSLDAKITFKSPESIHNFLSQFTKKKLANVFIVSQVSLESTGAESIDIDDIEIVVQKANGQKCERCWQIQPEVGEISGHPTLCNRCAKVVEAL